MAGTRSTSLQRTSSFATHNLHVSHRFFETMCNAINVLSVREHDLYSFRRLIAKVLKDPARPIYRMDIKQLDRICQSGWVTGSIRLPVRIDTATNDLLREFRDHAEQRLGRQVSVSEALAVCLHAVMPGSD